MEELDKLTSILENQIVDDIIRCADEKSDHNRKGSYSIDYCGKRLHIDFIWTEKE